MRASGGAGATDRADTAHTARAASSSGQRFWINTVSLDHVEAAVIGGFTQADHGANRRLSRPRPGDGMIFYSPRANLQGGDAVRQFTAVATITGEAPYQVVVSDDFRPCIRVDAKPLVGRLSFVADPTHWGLPFWRGLFTVPQEDFRTIATHMGASETWEP
jgi:hypothetical protein